jgi:hypothetical protein
VGTPHLNLNCRQHAASLEMRKPLFSTCLPCFVVRFKQRIAHKHGGCQPPGLRPISCASRAIGPELTSVLPVIRSLCCVIHLGALGTGRYLSSKLTKIYCVGITHDISVSVFPRADARSISRVWVRVGKSFEFNELRLLTASRTSPPHSV